MTFRWGIFGTGAISAKFVAGLACAKNARVEMVASRSGERATAFARAYNIARPIEGYEAAVHAGGVDAIYIATPPAQHLPHALACIEAGIPVLIEKPFALDASEARTIAAAARNAGIFCMEGMWTRFLPAAAQLQKMVTAREIGELRQLTGSFGSAYLPDPTHGNFDPARGGGALTHLGIYPISLGQWLLGTPVDVAAFGRLGETGIEEDVAITLRYENGALASFQSSLRANAANDFRLMGTQGTLALTGPIYRPFGVRLQRSSPRGAPALNFGAKARLRESGMAQRLAQLAGIFLPKATGQRHYYAGNGYHYEAEEVARCIESNRTESAVMPLNDTISVLDTIDRVKTAIGIRLAGEVA